MSPINSTSITPTVQGAASVSRTATVAEVNPNQDNAAVGLEASQRTNRTGAAGESTATLSLSTANLAALSQDRRAEQAANVSTASQARRYESMQYETAQTNRGQRQVEAMA